MSKLGRAFALLDQLEQEFDPEHGGNLHSQPDYRDELQKQVIEQNRIFKNLLNHHEKLFSNLLPFFVQICETSEKLLMRKHRCIEVFEFH